MLVNGPTQKVQNEKRKIYMHIFRMISDKIMACINVPELNYNMSKIVNVLEKD